MLKENNATESDLVLLALVVNEQEVKNQQVAKAASINSFDFMDLFVTPAYAQDVKCTTILKDVFDCAIEALGFDIGWATATSIAKTWTKAAIKKAFKSIAQKALGPVGAAIAAGKFIWCLHEKGLLF